MQALNVIDLASVRRDPANPRTEVTLALDPIATVRMLEADTAFTCLAGAHRLTAMLEAYGVADVTVSPTGDVIKVKMIDGRLIPA